MGDMVTQCQCFCFTAGRMLTLCVWRFLVLPVPASVPPAFYGYLPQCRNMQKYVDLGTLNYIYVALVTCPGCHLAFVQ